MRNVGVRGSWKRIVAVALLATALAACGDDDDDADTAATATGAAEGATENTLDLEMVDYAYNIKGTVNAGLVTINSSNTGEEWHMAGYGKLKPGKTLADVTKAMQEQGGGEGEGGGEQGDPTAELFEKEIGSPGHILQPGQRQSLTTKLDAGTYVVLCFIPTEGEGVPHVAKGMVNSFEVGDEKVEVAEPEADAEITLGDNAEPAGAPATIASGTRTFKLTSEGSSGKDFAIGQINEGQPNEPASFDNYFSTLFEQEGGPPKGVAKQAPGTLYGMTFELEPAQTAWITVDLKPGETFFSNTTNAESDGGDEEGVDKFVTVKVT